MTRSECALGIDVGTSGPKAAVVALDGHVLGTGQAGIITRYLADGGVEQDPEEMWAAVKDALAAALRTSGIGPADIAAILVSSQFGSVVPVDSSGKATGNFIIWQDLRGAKKLLRTLPGYPRRSDTPLQLLRWVWVAGVPPIDNFSLSHMRYLKYARPDVYERAATFLEVMDYVAMRLTGRVVANQCTAWTMILTDNRRHNVTAYDRRLLSASLVDEEKLPELVPVDSIVGKLLPGVAAELGLSPNTPVVAGINDTIAGAMGTGAFTGSHAGMQVGSSSSMIAHVKAKHTDLFNFLFTMPSPVPDLHCIFAENGMAGAALERILLNLIYADDCFGRIDPEGRYEALGEAVAQVPVGSDGLLFLPWMTGSLAPQEDGRVRGGFLNITPETTRCHLARAVLEGIALNMRWLRRPVEKFAKRKFSHFVFYGGGAESPAWCQIMADCLDAPVHQLDQPLYATCIGDALLAFQRLGMLGFKDIGDRLRVRQVFEPMPAHVPLYEQLGEQFLKAFKANRPVFRALNGDGSG